MASYIVIRDYFAKEGIIEILVHGAHIPAPGHPVAVRGEGLSKQEVLDLCAQTSEEVESNCASRN